MREPCVGRTTHGKGVMPRPRLPGAIGPEFPLAGSVLRAGALTRSPRRRGRPTATAVKNARHSIPMVPFAADDGVALNFDLGLGNGQGDDDDEGAAGEIVAEYFPPNLSKAVSGIN